jgi:hypothetical protein
MRAGDLPGIEASSPALQQLAVGLLQMAPGLQRGDVQSRKRAVRLSALSMKLNTIREGLVRQGAYVERALQVVMPSAALTTYQDGGPYRTVARPSGSFQVRAA